MKAKKLKRRGLADMDFGEGLARLIQTKPEEVRPPARKKRKETKDKLPAKQERPN